MLTVNSVLKFMLVTPTCSITLSFNFHVGNNHDDAQVTSMIFFSRVAKHRYYVGHYHINHIFMHRTFSL